MLIVIRCLILLSPSFHLFQKQLIQKNRKTSSLTIVQSSMLKKKMQTTIFDIYEHR